MEEFTGKLVVVGTASKEGKSQAVSMCLESKSKLEELELILMPPDSVSSTHWDSAWLNMSRLLPDCTVVVRKIR